MLRWLGVQWRLVRELSDCLPQIEGIFSIQGTVQHSAVARQSALVPGDAGSHAHQTLELPGSNL